MGKYVFSRSIVGVCLCAFFAVPAILYAADLDESPNIQKLGAAYYAGKYRISEEEATRRIAIQDQAAGIDNDLAALLGDQFAGIWYDAGDNGRLKIGLTSSGGRQIEEVRQIALRYGVLDVTDMVFVRYSISQLERIRDSIRPDLDEMLLAGHARTSYNTMTNRVTVKTLNRLSVSEEATLRRVSAVAGVSIVRTDIPSLLVTFKTGSPQANPAPTPLPNICFIGLCDPPFRGGRAFKNPTGCTAGFIAHYTSDPGVSLIMTAGHCIFATTGIGGIWSAKDGLNQEHNLGAADGYVFSGSYGGDAGVIRLDLNGFWASPMPTFSLIVNPFNSTTTFDLQYEIQHTSTSSMGQLLCRTGASTGTECGFVSDLGVDVAGDNINNQIYWVRNMGELDVCGAKGGDSGGPIYKKHKAYGLMVSGVDAGILGCYEYYQGIRGAQNLLNVNVSLSP
jgi:streptogrisin C